VKQAAEQNENARLLMIQPGVGPVTSLAFVLTLTSLVGCQYSVSLKVDPILTRNLAMPEEFE
jgi:hypothetical protein